MLRMNEMHSLNPLIKSLLTVYTLNIIPVSVFLTLSVFSFLSTVCFDKYKVKVLTMDRMFFLLVLFIPYAMEVKVVEVKQSQTYVPRQENVTILSGYPGYPISIKEHLSCASEDCNISISSSNKNIGLGIQAFDSNAKVLVYGNPPLNATVLLSFQSDIKEITILLHYCPPGLIFNQSTKSCICSQHKNIKQLLLCRQEAYRAYIFVGFCASRKNGSTEMLVTRCPFSDQNVHTFIFLNQDPITGQSTFCSDLNREGMLCGKCIDNHGVSVFSDTFDCIKCNGSHIQYIAEYIATELLPTTIFFMFVLYFHIAITTGPANGFIFFSQVVAMPIQVLFVKYGLMLLFSTNTEIDGKSLSKIMGHAIIDPYCIWNLDFSRIFQANICFSTKLRVIDTLSLRYISALYPLLLLGFTYAMIELQARNVRSIVWLWKVLCYPCMRWRRVWNVRRSIIDAFATCILLSYCKFMYVSFSLLSPSDVFTDRGSYKHRVLNFDPTIIYFTKNHFPYAALAIVIILTFGIFPPILLTCYQFHPFQEFLESWKLKRQGLQHFVEAFQGCYKDGTNGEFDCRFFAGLYFLFRVVILLIYTLAQNIHATLVLITSSSLFFLFLLVIFQPYKKNIHNVVDGFCFGLLGLINAIQLYVYIDLERTFKVNHLFLLCYFLLFLPLLYIIWYIGHWFFKRYKSRKKHLNLHITITDSDNVGELAVGHESSLSPLDVSPGLSITHTEVSLAELSQEECGGSSTDDERCESQPLLARAETKNQELENVSK